jgi:uncharacterized protein
LTTDVDIAGLLLEHGAECDADDENGRTPLHYASTCGSLWSEMHASDSLVSLLVSNCTTKVLNTQDRFGRTALHYAVQIENQCRALAIVLMLLEKADLDTNLRDTFGWTALDFAIDLDKPWLIELLERALDFGVNAGLFQSTALHRAVVEGHQSSVEMLLEGVMDVNTRDSFHETALHSVSATTMYCKVVMAKLLLGKGADIDTKNCIGRTPLHNAVMVGSDAHALVSLLLTTQCWSKRAYKG